ncbi:SDR family oxidoreductase [soil metagenome]
MQDRGWIALVTGGGRGLGRAIANRLAGEGAAVGLLARTVAEVEEAAGAIGDSGGQAAAFVGDVLDASSLDQAVRRFREWSGGRCDTLVCAAGRLRGIGPIGTVDPEDWWLDLETAVRGAQRSIRALLPDLLRSPRASIQLLVGPGHNGDLAFASGYGAAQAGLVRLAESLDKELRPDGVPVYAVSPGLVPTSLVEHLLQSEEGRRYLPRFTEAFAEGKEVGPEFVAEMVAWLAVRRPEELGGRVVPALATPEILDMRLARIQAEGLGRLRLR